MFGSVKAAMWDVGLELHRCAGWEELHGGIWQLEKASNRIKIGVDLCTV